jgi:hypothetical protein
VETWIFASATSADAALKDSRAVAGSGLGSGNESKSALGTASENGQTNASSSANDSSIRGGIYQLGFRLALIFLGLMVTTVVIWAVVKSVRSQEESQDPEVVYRNLNVVQIYGKIIKKY